MTGLALREEVAGAAQIECALADGKAGPRSAELLKYGKALFGLLRLGLGQQISESPCTAASHAAPELMKLGQTKLLGPTDNNGIRPGDVETALHDIGRQQNIYIAF